MKEIRFGSIFSLSDGEKLVYLVRTADILFAAKILNKKDTDTLEKIAARHFKRPDKKASDDIRFCYVLLTTEDLIGSSAHYGYPDVEKDVPINDCNELNEKDIEKLKNAIIGDNAANKALRKAVRDIFGIEEKEI